MSDYLEIVWSSDEQVEARIRSLGLDFSIKRLASSEIDVQGSRDLQTRFDSQIDEEHALKLAIQIGTSKRVDRLVCLSPLTGFKLALVADGNHRHFTLDDLLKQQLPPDFKFEVYFIDTQDEMLRDLIARSFNCIADKKSLTDEQRIRHIQYMLAKYDVTFADMAAYFGVQEAKVKRELMIFAQREELRKAGIPIDKFNDGHIRELAKIKQNDDLKRKIAHMVAQYQPTIEATGLCVNQAIMAFKTGGETAATKILIDHKKIWVTNFGAKGSGKRLGRRRDFLSLVGTFHTFLDSGPKGAPCENFGDCEINDQHDVSQIRHQWKAITKVMSTMIRDWDASRK
jgi:hypothetical protein